MEIHGMGHIQEGQGEGRGELTVFWVPLIPVCIVLTFGIMLTFYILNNMFKSTTREENSEVENK